MEAPPLLVTRLIIGAGGILLIALGATQDGEHSEHAAWMGVGFVMAGMLSLLYTVVLTPLKGSSRRGK